MPRIPNLESSIVSTWSGKIALRGLVPPLVALENSII